METNINYFMELKKSYCNHQKSKRTPILASVMIFIILVSKFLSSFIIRH